MDEATININQSLTLSRSNTAQLGTRFFVEVIATANIKIGQPWTSAMAVASATNEHVFKPRPPKPVCYFPSDVVFLLLIAAKAWFPGSCKTKTCGL